MNKKIDLDAMSVDEMWKLYEQITEVLSVRMTSEKRELEKRLSQLRRENEVQNKTVKSSLLSRERRKYPRVEPKYQNPDQPSETWSGRGKQPLWLVDALSKGHRIEEFAISSHGSDGQVVSRKGL